MPIFVKDLCTEKSEIYIPDKSNLKFVSSKKKLP